MGKVHSIEHRKKIRIFQDDFCTAPQKLDMKNLTFGVFFNEINL